MSVEAIVQLIMTVLPTFLQALQDILNAVKGGQPVTPAHLAALKAPMDELHAKIAAATQPPTP